MQLGNAMNFKTLSAIIILQCINASMLTVCLFKMLATISNSCFYAASTCPF